MRFGKKIDRIKGVETPSACSSVYLNYVLLFRDLRDAIANYVPTGVKVLDVGCGNKPYKQWFEGKYTEYVGCDVEQSSEEVVDLLCEATSIPLPDKTFDVVLCTQVIEHVFDPRKMLSEINRVLKCGGVLLLSGPFISHTHEVPYDYFRFTQFGMEELVKSKGFSFDKIYYNGGKWAVFGQMCCQVLSFKNSLGKLVNFIFNKLFLFLDLKFHHSQQFALNYVVVATKKEKLSE